MRYKVSGLTFDGRVVKSSPFPVRGKLARARVAAYGRAMDWISRQGGGSFEIRAEKGRNGTVTRRQRRKAMRRLADWAVNAAEVGLLGGS